MILGVPKEVKDGECRVALTPGGAKALVRQKHAVLVQRGAGGLAGYPDAEYRSAGARVLPSARAVWEKSGLVLKVKEPLPAEFQYLKPGKILFCYLHLAADRSLTMALVRSGIAAVAGETIRDSKDRLPLLEPMSELAGRMAAIVAAYYLSTPHSGRGVLVSGLPGVLPAHFVVIGGGTVGENAAKIASGMGAQVTILDLSQERLRSLSEILPGNVSTLASTPSNIEEAVSTADAVIGAVLIPGAKAPKLITRGLLKKFPRGSVLVDVCIDQGGISETSRPTSHSHPTYSVDGVLHYCVPNMPGAYGRTATNAYTHASLDYVSLIASRGLRGAFSKDAGLAQGLNVCGGRVTCPEAAGAHRLSAARWQDVL
ncbi:MAG: alanine dehydrogenase [Elusimicrobia bacterium RIFCSPLOWO2_01_FULL_64_13]|nr:MAG: alanine dehydrogenase [Elusimicrobia bacterium RIFCSPHIGHO2_01_FULL_64_10]OGR96321.1 MAG: alanine dehydrogenase [Elusimicrobia bacterium RIFCSPLOWO2_01_FULL_64_13]